MTDNDYGNIFKRLNDIQVLGKKYCFIFSLKTLKPKHKC